VSTCLNNGTCSDQATCMYANAATCYGGQSTCTPGSATCTGVPPCPANIGHRDSERRDNDNWGWALLACLDRL
jgi:hypothetical protein